MIIADRYRRSVIIGLLAGSFALAHLCFLAPAFQPWNLQATDLLFDLRNRLHTARPKYDPQVAYVEITDSSGAPLGTPYLRRAQYARLVESLSATRAALQVHDAVFRAPRSMPRDFLSPCQPMRWMSK